MGDFLRDYREPVGRILEGLAAYITESPRQKFRSMLSVFGILAFILVALIGLSLTGKVSGDSVTFLFGSIVGYLFAFLHRYVIGMA